MAIQTAPERREVIVGVGLADRPRKSRWPARMDLAQSASGLVLGLFMWGHMAFVSTILISNDAMWMVTKAFEGHYIFGRSFPQIVSVIVLIVSVLFMAHAFLAMRKFPANYRQYRLFIGHKNLLRHSDTGLWWFQAVTGEPAPNIARSCARLTQSAPTSASFWVAITMAS